MQQGRKAGTGILLLLGLAVGGDRFLSRAANGSPPTAEPTGAPNPVVPPVGLFVCRGPSLTPDKEVDYPFIRGWLVRPGWDKVEPQEGRYDWGYVEKEIAHARRLNKKIALAILGGPQTPEWVYRAGARDFRYGISDFTGRRTQNRIPVLWDEVYLTRWTALVKAAGQRFGADPTVVLVHMTGASENGLEMQLPHAPEDVKKWQEAGFTPDKAIAAWKRIVDAFASAFPDKPLDVDVHPVLGTDRVAQEVTAYALQRLGRHVGTFGGWLSGKSADQDRHHAGMHPIVKKFGQESFADFQLIASEVRQPGQFADGHLRSAIEQGLRWGACYFEVWEIDVMDPRMQPVLRDLAEEVERTARERTGGKG